MPNSATWTAATAAVRRPPPTSPVRLLHRDWTQASRGPRGLDVAHMRWNLVADHGQAVADRFAACYRAATGCTLDHQPYWDLVALLDLLLDGDDPGDITPDDLQRFEDYAKTLLRTPSW